MATLESGALSRRNGAQHCGLAQKRRDPLMGSITALSSAVTRTSLVFDLHMENLLLGKEKAP